MIVLGQIWAQTQVHKMIENAIADTFFKWGRKDDIDPLVGKNNVPTSDIKGIIRG